MQSFWISVLFGIGLWMEIASSLASMQLIGDAAAVEWRGAQPNMKRLHNATSD